MKTKHFFIGVAILLFQITYSQNTHKYVVSLSKSYGHVFATNATLRGETPYNLPIVYAKRTSLMFGKKLYTENWHKSFQAPTLGILLFTEQFANSKYIYDNFLGTPIVIAGYFKSKLMSKKKLSLNYDFGLGMAFNWMPYNDNNYNLTLGSKKSFYIEIGTTFCYQITNRIGLEFALGLTHYSNGAMALPNFGINSLNSTLKLAYSFGSEIEIEDFEYKSSFNQKTVIDVFAFGGTKSAFIIYDTITVPNAPNIITYSYKVFGTSATINRQISRKSKIGLGIILSENKANSAIAYQQSLPDSIIIAPEYQPGDFKSNLQVSIYPSYEFLAGPVSIIVQPSFYIHRGIKLDYIPTFHQRLGIKYTTKKGVFVGFNLRAYDYHVSDFIEWNIGYSIGGNKKKE